MVEKYGLGFQATPVQVSDDFGYIFLLWQSLSG